MLSKELLIPIEQPTALLFSHLKIFTWKVYAKFSINLALSQQFSVSWDFVEATFLKVFSLLETFIIDI